MWLMDFTIDCDKSWQKCLFLYINLKINYSAQKHKENKYMNPDYSFTWANTWSMGSASTCSSRNSGEI